MFRPLLTAPIVRGLTPSAAAPVVVLLLLGARGQAALVQVEQIRIALVLDIRNDVVDNPLILLGAGAHDLDEVAGLGDGLDGILQAVIVDPLQVHPLPADLADPDGITSLVPERQRSVGGAGAVGAERPSSESLVRDLLFVLGQCGVEFCDFRVIASENPIPILVAHGFALLYGLKIAIPGPTNLGFPFR